MIPCGQLDLCQEIDQVGSLHVESFIDCGASILVNIDSVIQLIVYFTFFKPRRLTVVIAVL